MMISGNRIVTLTIFIIGLTTLLTGRMAAAEPLVYSQLTEGYWQLWQMNDDGSETRQLTFSKSDKREAVCFSGGNTILYRTNNGQLKMMKIQEESQQEILAKYNRISNPDYCAAREEVVFVRYDPKGMDISDIWRADLNEQRPQILTRDHRLKYQPAYNQDCSQIAFVQADPEERKAHQIWLMDSEGQNQKAVTTDKALASGPQFLPGGQGLVFASNRNGGDYNIYRVGMSGQNMSALTTAEGLDTSPAVS
ncbi:MAG: hypothetical protein K8I00_10480, partial [Candidatus Omnitrophica bacterium]|nr:hypothetical protein [Candidatus Omnitrophota bacterium]